MSEKVVFLGLLSNVDTSILKLKLDHGFKVKKIDKTKFKDFLDKLKYPTGLSIHISNKTLWKIDTKSLDDSYYIITNSFSVDNKEDDDVADYIGDWLHNHVTTYLHPFLQKIRLFKGSSVHIHHFYLYYASKMELYLHYPNNFAKDGSILNLTDDDIKFFKTFSSIKIPFSDKNLNLAHKNYSQSFRISDWKLSFLILMIGVEILVSPTDKGELVNRISRNMAILLGENLEDAEEKFKDMKELYAYRSKIVHSGKENFSDKDFLKLRKFLGNAILEFNQIYENEDAIFGKNGKIKLKKLDKINNKHDKLLYVLNSAGFGERAWKQ